MVVKVALNTRVTASGQVEVKKLANWLSVTQSLPASGVIPYQLQLTFNGGDSQLMVNSNLKRCRRRFAGTLRHACRNWR